MPGYKALYEQQLKKNKELQEENKKLQEQVKKLQDEEYDPDNPNHVLVDADTESEEETDKYDGDDWRWVYGKMIVDKKMKIQANIPEGCSLAYGGRWRPLGELDYDTYNELY
jgi:cell division septum initiation protein DivIVA